NAVKFTPAGGQVTLKVKPEGTSIAISVTDTGIGIAGADLAKVGTPFFRAHAATHPSCDGTGLGLSLVCGLVGLHKGTIALESALGQGTRVHVRLPLERDQQKWGPVLRPSAPQNKDGHLHLSQSGSTAKIRAYPWVRKGGVQASSSLEEGV